MKRFIYSETFQIGENADFSDAHKFVEDTLKDIGCDKRLMIKALLSAEEVMGAFIEQATLPCNLVVKISKYLGDAQIVISMPGKHTDFVDGLNKEEQMEYDSSSDAQNAIRAIILKAQGNRVRFLYFYGINRARILVGMAEQSLMVKTLMALVLGIVFGVLMKFAFPTWLSDGICMYGLAPVKAIFMNALKMVIAPVVFLSIVSCFSQFEDIKEIGKISIKVMSMYLITTIIAVSVGMGISYLFQGGEFGFAKELTYTNAYSLDSSANTIGAGSLLETIINMVPDNFIVPFAEANTVQLIFMAVLCGLASGMLGGYTRFVKDLFDSLNSLFLTITTIIAGFIPVAVFCSMTLMVMQLGGSMVLPLVHIFLVELVGTAFMLIVYGGLILFAGHLNPVTFYKKNWGGMIASMMLSSSNAAIPINMRTCTEKLGISEKVSSFSIPLGSTVNMDGYCIFLTIFSTFLARAYGVTVDPSMISSIIITIVLLSISAPGVPGSGLVCLGILLEVMGVPLEAIGLVIGIWPFIEMIDTMSDTTGDVATALIVAKSENLVDLNIYNKKIQD